MTGRVTTSIQHRCKNMGRHHETSALPIPCDECYSLAVMSVRIPYQPSIQWTDVGVEIGALPPESEGPSA